MNTAALWYARRQRRPAWGMIAALAVGIAALVAVSAFAERVSLALAHGAAEALGGDLVIIADRAIPPHFKDEADRLGLRSARTTRFPSMIIAGDKSRLVEVKAVGPDYPLLGQLRVNDKLAAAPPAGEAWLVTDALNALHLAEGDRFNLGQITLRVAGRLDQEPDLSPGFFAIGPRVMIAEADLPASGLLGFGSRASHRLHLGGKPEALAAFADYARLHPERGLRIEGLHDTRPELRDALERAEGLLRVSGLIALLLAGLAVAIGMQDRLRAQLDAAAALRALGASGRFIAAGALLSLLPTAILGSLLGVAIGYAMQPLLPLVLHDLIPDDLPPASLTPAWLGLLAGPVMTLAFTLPAVLRLQATPVMRILRRHLEPPRWSPAARTGLLLSGGLLVLLVTLLAGATPLTAIVLGGALVLGLILMAAASLPIMLMRRRWLPAQSALLGRLAQPGARTQLTLATLGLGLMALTLAFSLRHDLLGGWAERLPPEAPNRFVINLMPDQLEDFGRIVAEAGLPAPATEPMIRGRLLEIDGQPISERPLEDGRARALAEREFNLSMAATHPDDNRIVAGREWRPDEAGEHWLSVEEGIAQRLGITLGSALTFDMAGETWTGTVLNLRKVRWDSFNVNFFVTTTPGALDGHPATWISSFYLPDASAGLGDRLVGQFPNITVIDVRAALDQVRDILARIERAVGLVLGFVLVSAWLVLWNTAAGTARTRRRETALLRTLGASRRLLRRQLIGEYLLLGALGGLLAALAASLTSAALGRLILGEWLPVASLPWLLTPLLGATLSALAGWLSLRGTLDTPPAQVLREAE